MDASASISSSSSFLSKAKTAFHSAAAKAEKVIADLKHDHHSQSNNAETKSTTKPPLAKDSCPSDSKNFISMVMNHDKSEQNASNKHVPKATVQQDFWRRSFAINKQKKQNMENKGVAEHASGEQNIPEDNCYNKQKTNIIKLEIPEKDSAEEHAYAKAFMMVTMSSSSILHQLASAIEGANGFKTMNDLALKCSTEGGDWPGLMPNFSAMRILSLRDKDEKFRAHVLAHEEDEALLSYLFGADTPSYRKYDNSCSILSPKAQLPAEIHGAPPWSFVPRLAEIIGGFKKIQRMGTFWLKVIGKLRNHWNDGQPIPWLPVDDNPDLRYCLLHQQLQVINCCIARKKRRLNTIKMLNSDDVHVPLENEYSTVPSVERICDLNLNVVAPALYAKLKTGEIVQRHGVLSPTENMAMLETGEPIFSPITQEGPILTEDLLRETEEMIVRTGSDGAGFSQLFSDMQAFKAANPGCILEDFVRWHSPPDWKEYDEVGTSAKQIDDSSENSSRRGHLSRRMQSEGNLWREFWEFAKPIPVAKQSPIFDEDLAGECALRHLEDIAPSSFFMQLFISMLGSGFAIAEADPATKTATVNKLFNDCKEYVTSKCDGEKLDQDTIASLCKVYETIEVIMFHPHEDILIKSSEATVAAIPRPEASESSFEKLGFSGIRLPAIDRNLFRKRTQEKIVKNEKDENSTNFFSRLVDGKKSLFGKNDPKHPAGQDISMKSDNEWTFL